MGPPSTVIATSNACEPSLTRPSSPESRAPRTPMPSDSTVLPRRATRFQVRAMRDLLQDIDIDTDTFDALFTSNKPSGDRFVDDLLLHMGPPSSTPPTQAGDPLRGEIESMHQLCRAAQKKRKEEAAAKKLKRLNGASPGPVRSPPQGSPATTEKAEKRASASHSTTGRK